MMNVIIRDVFDEEVEELLAELVSLGYLADTIGDGDFV